MKKEHNFNKKNKDSRAPQGMSVWWCQQCDTEVIFDDRHTKFEVNKLMTIKMPCLPPIVWRN
jgi:hypothetical protein